MEDTNPSTPQMAVSTKVTENEIQGNLLFDSGLPAASITVRLYNIGYGGQPHSLTFIQPAHGPLD